MRAAIVVGGWHWPAHLFREIAANFPGADLFVIAHRNPELAIVREEKRDILAAENGPLADLDRELYAEYPTVVGLQRDGWRYREEPNTVGDWGFFNQWLERHSYRQYDVILNCHDDTYIRRRDLAGQLKAADKRMNVVSYWDGWLLLANGRYPQAPDAYVRGSFEFWKPELLDALGGRIDLGDIDLTREGLTDSPAGLDALSAWNDTAVPLRRFMASRGLAGRIAYLSPHYRISPWAIECERGFVHKQGGAPWSFTAGLEAYPMEVAV